MANTQSFTGIALEDSEGGSVRVLINRPVEDVEQYEAEPLSVWEEVVPDDEKDEQQLVSDAEADYTTDAEDPASLESEPDAEEEEVVSEQFDEGAE